MNTAPVVQGEVTAAQVSALLKEFWGQGISEDAVWEAIDEGMSLEDIYSELSNQVDDGIGYTATDILAHNR